jgi:Ser/Thr protein kinase RdoA (MazF antagonist)
VGRSAELVATARPDVAVGIRSLARCLLASPPPGDDPVLVHGDCHPNNALVDGGRLSLIDLDQAGVGSPSADVGSVLARLIHGECVGERDPDTSAAMAAAFLAGYARVRPLPPERSVRWHTVAAVVAERALRAVNRVNRPALACLDEVVSAGARVWRAGAW